MQRKLKQTFKVIALLTIISCNYNSQDATRKLKKKRYFIICYRIF